MRMKTISFLLIMAVALAGDSLAQAQRDHAQPAPDDSFEHAIRELSDSRLKELYLRCGALASQRRLDPAEIAVCSVDSDALLTRVFKGDFEALLSWAKTAAAFAPVVQQHD
jgi:hypothetical protein